MRLVLTPQWIAFVFFSLVSTTDATQDVLIGVLDVQPGEAQRVSAAAEAGSERVIASVASLEAGEELSVPLLVCALQPPPSALLLSSHSSREAKLCAAAAGRAGAALILLGASEAPHALSLWPSKRQLWAAAAHFAREAGWRDAVLLHEGAPIPAPQLAESLVLRPRALPPADQHAQLRNLLLVLKKSGATNFIVWGNEETAERVLLAAQRAGILGRRQSFLLMTPDLHLRDLDPYSHAGANVTVLRLIDPQSPNILKMQSEWRKALVRHLGEEAVDAVPLSAPATSLVLAYDVAHLIASALDHLDLPQFPSESDACATGAGYLHADTLLNYLRSEEWASEGSGVARWSMGGERVAASLQAAELQRGGKLQGVLRWSATGEVQSLRPPKPAPPRLPDTMTNRTFTVLIAMNSPYVMRQESTERLSGNDRYEGFCVELIQRLSELLSFNYTLVEQIDGKYGKFENSTGKWNGMLQRLIEDSTVDFAITDLTITAEREQAVDFTTTFMNLGISILFRKPQPPEPEVFAFLLPFSNGVWLSLGFAYLLTSLVLYCVGRLCPEEWQNPHPCDEEPSHLTNQFTLANALWFNLGAVLLQGSEVAPVAYGTRAVASVWWLFALVITSSYTANLATLLAQKTSYEVIHSVEDLYNNKLGITYGAKSGGSTYTFFEHSQSPMYKDMFEQMKSQTMPSTNEEGINKVVNENYAFFAESTTIEYTVERNCEVNQVGGLLDSKGYGIAMKKSSPYRQSMNLALLNLQESGVLREMKNKWWMEKHGGGACKAEDERESERLTMNNFRGLFIVLAVGSAGGVVLSLIDLALAAARTPSEKPYSRRLADELRFVFRFSRGVKPLRASPSPPALTAPSPRVSLRRRRSSQFNASLRLARHASSPDSS